MKTFNSINPNNMLTDLVIRAFQTGSFVTITGYNTHAKLDISSIIDAIDWNDAEWVELIEDTLVEEWEEMIDHRSKELQKCGADIFEMIDIFASYIGHDVVKEILARLGYEEGRHYPEETYFDFEMNADAMYKSMLGRL